MNVEAPATHLDAITMLEQEMGVLTRRIRRVMAERARMVHPELPVAAYSILTFLNQRGPCRASELVGMFTIDKGAVSRHVQHLEELTLIERKPDPADRRAALLSVTDTASQRLAEIVESRREEWRHRLGDWSDEEIFAFVAALKRYNATLS